MSERGGGAGARRRTRASMRRMVSSNMRFLRSASRRSSSSRRRRAVARRVSSWLAWCGARPRRARRKSCIPTHRNAPSLHIRSFPLPMHSSPLLRPSLVRGAAQLLHPVCLQSHSPCCLLRLAILTGFGPPRVRTFCSARRCLARGPQRPSKSILSWTASRRRSSSRRCSPCTSRSWRSWAAEGRGGSRASGIRPAPPAALSTPPQAASATALWPIHSPPRHLAASLHRSSLVRTLSRSKLRIARAIPDQTQNTVCTDQLEI